VIAAVGISEEITTTVATAVVAFAALIIFAGSLASVRGGSHAGRILATYLGVGLEFLLAAGLIRLASADTFPMLGLAAAIIVVRRTIVLGLGYATRAAS
jgi:Protein of unknown function (DUF1622)